MDKFFKVVSKGFDFSQVFTKDEDMKDILIGISAILAIIVSIIKVYQNIKSFKNYFSWKK